MSRRKKVLVAPLDWGLGHATRCIPVIRELLMQDADVIIAADGRPFDLLKKEFPFLAMIRLPGFSIKYPAKEGIVLKIIQQVPGMIRATFKEHRTLQKLIREQQVDAVISDNRFGLFSRSVPCVYITHQIAIMMPRQFRWIARLVYHLNKLIIGRYTECWIPDYAGKENLSGELSHGYPPPTNATFIGPLTRFRRYPDIKKEYDLLIVLSGPEPQRTLLENILMEQLKTVNFNALVVRGLPEKNQRIRISDTISVVSSLESEALNKAMLASDIIISRPGYSTIMDIAALGRNAIFIPTPGQTEQEYVAGELEKKELFFVARQDTFNLRVALEKSKHYTGFSHGDFENSGLRDSIVQFFLRLN